jgi:hypothetical protein
VLQEKDDMRERNVIVSVFVILAVFAASLGGVYVGRALASPDVAAAAPGLIGYQGYLTEAGGLPFNGNADLTFGLYTASSGGSPLWSETQSSVNVANGYFNVLLGSVNPLNAADFSDQTRFLQVSVDTGGGVVDLPRQRLASAPYALVAASAPWGSLTGMPAGFADGIDDVGGGAYAQVVVVAKSGGDFTSIQDALNSISDNSSSKHYLVWIAPGVYTEQVTMKPYVDLEGAGEQTTEISYTGAAALDTGTVIMSGNAELRTFTVRNTGGNTNAVPIYNNGSFSRIRNVTTYATGATNTNYGLNNAGSSLVATHLTINANCSGAHCTGIYNHVSVFNLNDSQINLTNSSGGFSKGIENYNNMTLSGVSISSTTTGSGNVFAVINNGASMTARYSSFVAFGGSGSKWAIYNWSGSGNTVNIDTSYLESATNTIYNEASYTTHVGLPV